MRVLFLDVDGVLNRTGFHPGESVGLRSWIEPELARRLSDVLRTTGAVIVLSSDWRRGRPEAIVIVDDGYDMGALGARFVRASPLSGFDDDVARAIVALFERPS